MVHEFWEKGTCDSDWFQGRLKMLLKNKDMKLDLGNWRGIMLFDTASKIVCAIFTGRLTRLLEAERMEEWRRNTVSWFTTVPQTAFSL